MSMRAKNVSFICVFLFKYKLFALYKYVQRTIHFMVLTATTTFMRTTYYRIIIDVSDQRGLGLQILAGILVHKFYMRRETYQRVIHSEFVARWPHIRQTH